MVGVSPGHCGAIRRVLAAFVVAVSVGVFVSPRGLEAQGGAPTIERPVAFDAAGRILVMTPTLAARWKLSGPEWPLAGDWRDARLYSSDAGTTTLVVQRVDGSVARYAYAADALMRLRALVDAAVVAQGGDERERGTTSTVVSEPAGNALIRNQTVLGLIAYGPATAAILSDNGAAAAGGYLLAAGSSFFIAAQMVRNRSVTRSQTILGFHGGTRGSIAGAAIAAIANADGGPGYGVPILVGALGGTVAGFRAARGMSDGEAASSGFGADLAAVTTVGLAGAIGAFDEDTSHVGDGLTTNGKVALGSALAAGVAGYLIGPRYARRATYNVTAGDIDVSFTSAALGALAANAVIDNSTDARTRFAVSTGGVLIGALVADRTKVRHADRTSADGTLVQLGAIAGMLMGGGVALAAESESQPTIAFVAAGGIAGLALADALVRPARDAGARRGVLPSEDGSSRADGSSRVSLSIAPAVASAALAWRAGNARRVPAYSRPVIRRVPVMRVSF